MSKIHIPRGPVMADVNAFYLTDIEKQRLSDPAVGGVILFRRNFEHVLQLKALVTEIKALREPELVIAVTTKAAAYSVLLRDLPVCPPWMY